ncbi:hypothetical protein [Flavobacterium tructae]
MAHIFEMDNFFVIKKVVFTDVLSVEILWQNHALSFLGSDVFLPQKN